jgi:hypothetical protein
MEGGKWKFNGLYNFRLYVAGANLLGEKGNITKENK